MKTTKLTALLSTQCQCEDEEGNLAEFCEGCGEWMEEGTRELLTEWLALTPNAQRVRIEGRRLGWRRADGYAIVEADNKRSIEENIIKTICVDGDFTIHLALWDDGKLRGLRVSHDEPTGAELSFTAEEVTE